MRKTFSFAASSVVALATIYAFPASAASGITCDNPTNASSCSFFHNFGTSSPDGEVSPGRGVDTFTFIVKGMKTLTGSLGNLYTSMSQNVNFPAGGGAPLLTGGTLTRGERWITTALGNPDTREIGPLLLGAGTYTVTVNYRSGADGFYNGTLALVSAIPEPATWALMILGFGLVGGALRARKVKRTPGLAS